LDSLNSSKRIEFVFLNCGNFVKLMDKGQTIFCHSDEESLICIKCTTCDFTILPVVVFHRHALSEIEVDNEFDFSIIVTNSNDVSIRFGRQSHVGDKSSWIDWNGFQWSSSINLANVNESIELALRTDNELLDSIRCSVRHDSSN
jgi:hypothetical protein